MLTALGDSELVGGVSTRRSRGAITLQLPSSGTGDGVLLLKRNLREAANTRILEGDRLGLTRTEYWIRRLPIEFLRADSPPVPCRNTDAPQPDITQQALLLPEPVITTLSSGSLPEAIAGGSENPGRKRKRDRIRRLGSRLKFKIKSLRRC